MKIIMGMALSALLSSSLYAGNQNEFDGLFNTDIDTGGYVKKYEERRRTSLSPEERAVEDLEKENRLKQRQRDAEAEKKRLEQEKKDAEYEQKSTLEKAKSWFN